MAKKGKEVYWADRLVCDTLRFLRDSDDNASVKDVREHIRNNSDIPDEKKAPGARGKLLWIGGMGFQTIRYVQAGLMRRAKGIWYITPLGKESLDTKTDAEIAEWVKDRWRQSQPELPPIAKQEPAAEPGDADDDKTDDTTPVTDRLEEYHASANESVSEFIESMGPFAFQDLVAALFRGMGYYVHSSMVSPKNTADGGIDVIAYQGDDPLGAKTPRIKAQVKHQKDSKTGKPELQKLLGTMTVDGDIGVFISTGGFARGCREFVKQESRQLELIDMPRFIELWRDNYDKLSDEDKSLLPLQPIYFLDEERAKRS